MASLTVKAISSVQIQNIAASLPVSESNDFEVQYYTQMRFALEHSCKLLHEFQNLGFFVFEAFFDIEKET